MADETNDVEVTGEQDAPKTGRKAPRGKVYVVTEPGGFPFKGRSYQEHERYTLSELKELGWTEDDIKAAHRMLKEAQDA